MVSLQDLHALEAALREAAPAQLDVDLGTAASPSGDLVQALAQAVHASRSAIMLTDAELDEPGPTIRYANPACEVLTGYTADELIGRNPRLLQGDATDRAVLDGLRTALQAGRSFEGRAVNYRADGTPFIMSWRVSPVRDATGAVTGYVSIQEDVTEGWMAELRVHERLSALQELISPPSVPQLEHLEVVAVQEPVDDRNHVGGDWCDVVVGPDGRVHLVVGDVTGHGVIAAMQIGRFRWALRALLHTGTPPERAIRALGAVNPDAPVFASIGLVSIDPDGALEVITAGHPDVIVHRAHRHERVRSAEPLVGLGDPVEEAERTRALALAPGDVVCVYSDGLVERRDEDVDAVIDRVARWIDDHPLGDGDLREHARRLVRDVSGPQPGDDVLVVMARVVSSPP